GIGKSTLLLAALDRLSGESRPVLYVSGEESLQQIRLRGERLGTLSSGLHLAAETDAEVALEHARKLKPRVVAIDSIQAMALRALFLSERPRDAPGSAVVSVMNGSRPLLVEVQALVADSASGGSARRTAVGVDSARVALLTAVLERKEGIVLADKDIYVSVAGGATLPEPAGDLAVVAALMSSLRDKPIAPATLVLGEVGLAGEV